MLQLRCKQCGKDCRDEWIKLHFRQLIEVTDEGGRVFEIYCLPFCCLGCLRKWLTKRPENLRFTS